MFNLVTQFETKGFTLLGFVWPSGLPPFFFVEHVLMLWLSIEVSWLIFILVILVGGCEATPLQVARVPLMVGGSIPCQQG